MGNRFPIDSPAPQRRARTLPPPRTARTRVPVLRTQPRRTAGPPHCRSKEIHVGPDARPVRARALIAALTGAALIAGAALTATPAVAADRRRRLLIRLRRAVDAGRRRLDRREPRHHLQRDAGLRVHHRARVQRLPRPRRRRPAAPRLHHRQQPGVRGRRAERHLRGHHLGRRPHRRQRHELRHRGHRVRGSAHEHGGRARAVLPRHHRQRRAAERARHGRRRARQRHPRADPAGRAGRPRGIRHRRRERDHHARLAAGDGCHGLRRLPLGTGRRARRDRANHGCRDDDLRRRHRRARRVLRLRRRDREGRARVAPERPRRGIRRRPRRARSPRRRPASRPRRSTATRSRSSWADPGDAVQWKVFRTTREDIPFEHVGTTTEPTFTDTDVLTTRPYLYQRRGAERGRHVRGIRDLTRPRSRPRSCAQAEYLDRAPVAVQTDDGVYVGWRLLGLDDARPRVQRVPRRREDHRRADHRRDEPRRRRGHVDSHLPRSPRTSGDREISRHRRVRRVGRPVPSTSR